MLEKLLKNNEDRLNRPAAGLLLSQRQQRFVATF
jgi:hypothetical protein